MRGRTARRESERGVRHAAGSAVKRRHDGVGSKARRYRSDAVNRGASTLLAAWRSLAAGRKPARGTPEALRWRQALSYAEAGKAEECEEEGGKEPHAAGRRVNVAIRRAGIPLSLYIWGGAAARRQKVFRTRGTFFANSIDKPRKA